MDEVERRARLICSSLHAIDPDVRVFPDHGGRIGMMFIEEGVSHRAWELFVEVARALIADEERRAEEKQTVELAPGEKITILADTDVPGFGRVMLRLWPDELVLWAGGRMVATIMRGESS